VLANPSVVRRLPLVSSCFVPAASCLCVEFPPSREPLSAWALSQLFTELREAVAADDAAASLAVVGELERRLVGAD
jgi:hypothetical protein